MGYHSCELIRDCAVVLSLCDLVVVAAMSVDSPRASCPPLLLSLATAQIQKGSLNHAFMLIRAFIHSLTFATSCLFDACSFIIVPLLSRCSLLSSLLKERACKLCCVAGWRG